MNNQLNIKYKFDSDFIKSLTITDKSEIPPVEPIISINDTVFAIRGGVSMVTGKRGSGKTTILKRIVTLALMESVPDWYDSIGIKTARANGKPIFYINTETPSANVKKGHDEILKNLQLSETPPNLYIVNALRLTYEDRNELIKGIFKSYPDTFLMLIDGGADTVDSVNNEVASVQAIESLIKLSDEHQSTIINVVHENSGNGQTRGHYGQHCERKATGIISVSYNMQNESFTMQCMKIRETAHFKSVSFAYNKQSGNIEQLSTTTNPQLRELAKKDGLLELVHICFKDQKRYRRSELVKLISKIEKVSEKTGTRRVSDMFTKNYITNDGVDYVVCLSQIPTDATESQFELYDTDMDTMDKSDLYI